jgi:hypothetical protein
MMKKFTLFLTLLFTTATLAQSLPANMAEFRLLLLMADFKHKSIELTPAPLPEIVEGNIARGAFCNHPNIERRREYP